MFKFNNNHIFTGYIKQLLASFNLPTCRIYTKQHRQYKEKYGEESPEIIKSIIKDDGSNETLTRYIPYIKNGEIQEYVQARNSYAIDKDYTWKRFWAYQSYEKGKKIYNYTKNLKIKNNIYDSYTHEYLGDYLRFLRDHDNLDLMPLYNCFSNRICTNLLFECEHYNTDGSLKTHFIFNSNNLQYKIFMLPVKLFKEYTIAIDSASPVEICCGVYGKYQDKSDLFDTIAHNTYVKYGKTNFNTPVLFSKLKNLNTFISTESLVRLAQREADLKMFIKLPVDNTSTITVLEGNYCSWNDQVILTKEIIKADEVNDKKYTTFVQYKNHFITNYFDEESHKIISDEKFDETRTFTPITQLQLLTLNTGESYPFSNYLVEYLLDNAVTQMDKISDNIKRIQVAINENTNGKIAHTNELGEQDGIWDSRIQPIIYDALQHNLYECQQDNNEKWYLISKDAVKVKHDKCIDNLGYLNHIAEYEYKCYKNKNGKKIAESVANIDIYPDIYLEQKEK